MKVRLGTLREFLIEVVKEVLAESEIYVDENGWAHDDEGNRWFVGKGRPGTGATYSASGYRKQFGGGASSPAGGRQPLSPEQRQAIATLVQRVPGNDFLMSISSQAARGLTAKQKAAIKKFMLRAGMPEASLF